MLTAWDTSVVSRLHPTGRYHSLFTAREAQQLPVLVTAPTILETRYGIARGASANRDWWAALPWYERFFDGPMTRVLPVDGAASALAGELRARQPVPPAANRSDRRSKPDRRVAWVLDILVAATAWTAGYGIATHNRGDFELLGDLIGELYPGVSPLVVEDPPDGKSHT